MFLSIKAVILVCINLILNHRVKCKHSFNMKYSCPNTKLFGGSEARLVHKMDKTRKMSYNIIVSWTEVYSISYVDLVFKLLLNRRHQFPPKKRFGVEFL